MKVFLFITLLILQNTINAQSNAPAQVSELRLWGINGKVRKLTSYLMLNPKGYRVRISDVDTSKWFSRSTVNYDSVGNVFRIEYTNGSGSNKSSGVITYQYTPYGYTAQNVSTGHPTDLYKRVWHNSRSYTDSIFSADSTLIGATKTRLDNTGKVKTEEHISKGSVPEEVYVTNYLYDKRGNLVGKTFFTKNKKSSHGSSTWRNERFDAYGNPCVTFKFQDPGGTEAMIVYRVFEYDDKNLSDSKRDAF